MSTAISTTQIIRDKNKHTNLTHKGLLQVLQQPLCFIRNVFHNVRNFTVQYPAKHINGVGTDTFVPFQPCKLTGTDVILLDQGILTDALFLHNIPEIIVRNHSIQAPLST